MGGQPTQGVASHLNRIPVVILSTLNGIGGGRTTPRAPQGPVSY